MAGYCWDLLGVVEHINNFIFFLLKRDPNVKGALDSIKHGTTPGSIVAIQEMFVE